MLNKLVASFPRFPRRIERFLAHFDEEYYLANRGGLGNLDNPISGISA
jgi:hypothetical protein